MRKNVASQVVAFQAVSATDGSAVTSGTPVVYYTIDGGTQGTGTATPVHEGNGQWSWVPTQAETNGNHLAYTFTLTGCISQTVNIYTVSFDPHDTTRLGISALPNAAAGSNNGLPTVDGNNRIAGIQGTITTLDALDTAQDTQHQSTVNLIGSGGANLTAVPWNAAWDAEVQSEVNDGLIAFWTSPATLVDLVWDEATSGHTTAGTTGKALTDAGSAGDPWSTSLPGAYGAGTAGYIVGTNLDATVSSRNSTTPPTTGAIADAVWDETLADHLTAGSTGASLNAAGSAGDPWTTTLPGSYTGSQAGKILADILADTGTSLPAALSMVEDNLDEVNTSVLAILEDTGTTIPAALTQIDFVVDTILIDTNELQTDWADGGRLDLLLDARATAADVNAQVIDVLSVDTFAEPSGVPAATATIVDKIGVLYAALRNKVTVTATKKTFYDDADNAEWEKDITDDGTTYTESEGNAV